MLKEIRSNLRSKRLFDVVTTNTTTFSSSIDTQKFRLGVLFSLQVTTFTDGDYAITLQESSDDITFTDIEAERGGDKSISLNGLTADTATLSTLSPFSTKRYLRKKIVSTNVTVGATVGSVVSQMAQESPVI